MNHTQTLGGRSPSSFRRLCRWLFALAGLAALAASVQAATVTGRVLNKGTGDYLKYAQVQIVGTEQTTITEEGGVFTLTNVAAGEIKLRVTYTGLDSQEIAVTVPAEGSVSADVSLSTADYGELVTLGEYKVSSAREGNAKAIVEQRQALNLKTVVAADTFGDVSEGNVGEFLRLLPGVTVDYVDNDVRTTRIRGLPAKYATTTIDGHMVATAGSSSINTGRQFELEQVSMTSLDTIENAKSPTPDMMTPGLAGNTNALSKSAFNQKGRSIKYQASVLVNQYEFTYNKTAGWDDKEHRKLFPSAQAEWVDTLFDGKLGIVLSAGHSGSYNEQRAITSSETFDRNPDNNDTETALVTQVQLQDGPKITNRESMLLNLEYKVTDDLKLSFHTSYGYYRAEFYNRNWQLNASTTAQLNLPNATTLVSLGYAANQTTQAVWGGANGELTTSFVRPSVAYGTNWGSYASTTAGANTQTNAFITGSNMRKSGGTFLMSPTVEWKAGDFKVNAGASYSQAKSAYAAGQDGFFSYIQAYMPNVSWKYDKSGDRSYHIYQTSDGTGANAGSMLDIKNYTNGGLAINERRNGKDQIWTANADVEWDRSDWAVPTKFKAGVNTSLNVLDIETIQARWKLTLTSGASSASAINLADYADPLTPNVRGGVILKDQYGTEGYMPSADKWALWQKFLEGGNTDMYSLTANGAFQADVNNNLRQRLMNQYDIKEKIQTAYVMSTIKPTKKLTVIAGLRFEKTNTDGRSYDDKGAYATLKYLGYTDTYIESMSWTTSGGNRVGWSTGLKTLAAIGTTGSQFMDYITYRYGSRINHKRDYTNVLPSVQGRYSVQKNLVARAAYYKSLLRPDFQNAVGGVAVSDSTDTPNKYTFTVRNTDLKPETSDNFDASLEYYFEPVGVVSVTGFYKKVKDIQVNTSQTVDLANLPEEITDLGYNASNITADSSISQYLNGPKTSIWGLEFAYSQELSFLPGALKGLGVTANYTYISPEDDRIWALVPNAGDGLSKNAFNFIVRYKLDRFSAQVTTTWADKKINSIGGLTLKSDGSLTPSDGINSNVYAYIRERWQMNVSLNYKLNRYATLFLNASNVFNEPQYRYNEQEVYTNRHGVYGGAYTLGVKGQF